jgi:hypothetical protein
MIQEITLQNIASDWFRQLMEATYLWFPKRIRKQKENFFLIH